MSSRIRFRPTVTAIELGTADPNAGIRLSLYACISRLTLA